SPPPSASRQWMLTPLKRAGSKSRPSAGRGLVSITVPGLTNTRTFPPSGRVAGNLFAFEAPKFKATRKLITCWARFSRAGNSTGHIYICALRQHQRLGDRLRRSSPNSHAALERGRCSRSTFWSHRASHGGRNPPDRGERMRLYSLRPMQTEVTDIHGNVRNSRKPNRL